MVQKLGESPTNTENSEGVEIDAMRRSMRILRRDGVRNKIVRKQMGIEGTIFQDIESKQLVWYGHVQRMADTRLPKRILQ